MNPHAAKAAVYCVALARLATAAHASAPNVVYSASGTFATPALSGDDVFVLQGQPFSIRIEANEASAPTKQTKTSALYSNLVLESEVNVLILGGPLYISTHRASLLLETGAADQPGHLTIYFPYTIVGFPLTISANVVLPPGTITTTGIQPFTAPVTLAPADATATYANSSDSTTLAIAAGTFNATLGPPPTPVSPVYRFAGADGFTPQSLVAAPNGALYGTTIYGGTFDGGTVFTLARTPDGPWTETELYSFTGAADGANPSGGLLLGAGGVLYGTTSYGGAFSVGTVFKLTPQTVGGGWIESTIYDFAPSGETYHPNPMGSLVAGADGVLYGITQFGGVSNAGMVFQLTPPSQPGGGWSETTLYSFNAYTGDGANPLAGLMMEHDGTLYGTTSAGGSMKLGTVFRLQPPGPAAPTGSAWTETVLYSFLGAPDGSTPRSPLVASNGFLYGATEYGGSNTSCPEGCGTVFALSPRAAAQAWSETVIYNFQGAATGDGYYPSAGLLVGSGGALYGATPIGGMDGWGTVFRLVPAAPGSEWSETILASFSMFDGATPTGALASGPSGELNGATMNGGTAPCTPQNLEAAFCGTIFQVAP